MTVLDVLVLGRGKVGRTLTRAWRSRGWKVSLRQGRSRTVSAANLLVFAVPDGALPACAARVAVAARKAGIRAAVHCAGALSPAVLEALRKEGIPVAQMHPLVAFAARGGHLPEHAAVLVQGDSKAVALAKRAVRKLGLVPVSGPIKPLEYHAAAALVSNGAVALVSAAADLLVAAGLSRRDAGKYLGPLLASTGFNVRQEGLPRALTGPVRRGDARTVERHRAAIEAVCPEHLLLFRELVRIQLKVAAEFPAPERADPGALESLVAVLERRRRTADAGALEPPTKPRARSQI